MRNAVTLCVTVWLFIAGSLAAVPQAAGVTPQDHSGTIRVYDALLEKQPEDRQTAFIELSSSQKTAVWTDHLLTALAEHPEFTTEQRAVIQYALSVLTPAFAEIQPEDPQWAQVVEQPLRELEQRASAVFTRKQIVNLFGQLGGAPAGSPVPGAIPLDNPGSPSSTRPPARIAPLDVIQVPQCHCNRAADFCDSSGVGFYYCRGGGCWPTSSGCGWFWRASCNGLCMPREGGGGG